MRRWRNEEIVLFHFQRLSGGKNVAVNSILLHGQGWIFVLLREVPFPIHPSQNESTRCLVPRIARWRQNRSCFSFINILCISEMIVFQLEWVLVYTIIVSFLRIGTVPLVTILFNQNFHKLRYWLASYIEYRSHHLFKQDKNKQTIVGGITHILHQ